MGKRPALVLLLSLIVAATATAKSVHWKSIDVVANLDRDGRLHVVETQAFVFDGDWNGGERRFNLRAGQSLQLEGVDRIDANGRAIPLAQGDLSQVDHYQLVEGTKLRWRSRLPNDPEFQNTEITYAIRYVLSGILRGRGSDYLLDHNFVFPDRDGAIDHFSLRLTVDPVWSGIDNPFTLTLENLAPGAGAVVRRELHYSGSGAPGGAVVRLTPATGYAFAALLLIGLALLALRFIANERARGRFGNLTPTSAIDQAWLETNVFSLRPEVAGAAIDGKVGSPEIAAILAGLAADKKIESHVEKKRLGRDVLHMRLLVDQSEITGYAHKVIAKLFFGGRKETDTETVQQQYKGIGLDLAELVRAPIQEKLTQIPNWMKKKRVVSWKADLVLLLAALAFEIFVALQGGNETAHAGLAFFVGGIALVGSLTAARLNSRALTGLPGRFVLVFAFSVPLLFMMLFYALHASEYVLRIPSLLAGTFWTLAIVNAIFDALRTDESDDRIAFRKRLISARNFFIEQLASREPKLSDAWVPYLLAFGLGGKIDSWFHAFGGAAGNSGSAGAFASNMSSSSSSGGDSSSGWSGGGGAFGGAGATGSWAIAATALGSGVAAPSNSSSGGGGGGGGSSGGGGGGGW